MNKKIFGGILGAATFAPVVAQAQGLKNALGNLEQTGTVSGAGSSDLPSIVGLIINVAFSLLGIILVSLVIYSGYLWMTALGNEERIKKAKSILSSSIIGLIIVLSSYAIATFVLSRLAG